MSVIDQASVRVIKAQSGDRSVREQLISDHMSFIRRTVRHLTHAVFVDQMDEFSIALSAFNEAIDRYQDDSQVPFEQYARILIKHRLTDWFRSQRNKIQTYSLSDQSFDDTQPLEEQLTDPKSEQVQANLEYEESILRLQAQIENLGFGLDDLVNRFPKHRDTRLLCIRLARCLISNDTLFERLIQSGRLPGKDLSLQCDIPLKTVERNRPAVILLALLLKSDLQQVQAYIDLYEGGTHHEEGCSYVN